MVNPMNGGVELIRPLQDALGWGGVSLPLSLHLFASSTILHSALLRHFVPPGHRDGRGPRFCPERTSSFGEATSPRFAAHGAVMATIISRPAIRAACTPLMLILCR